MARTSVPLRYWGGKGGSDLGMGSVTGYGFTERGNHILYAIARSGMLDERADWRVIDRVLGWICETLDQPDGS